MRQIAVSPSSSMLRQEWLRGPARQEGDWIVLDRARATSYDPVELLHRGGSLAVALARIDSPTAAVAFVRDFGVLEWGIRDKSGEFEPIGGPAPTSKEVVAEPYRDFAEPADTFRQLIRAAALVAKSGDGDRAAARRLRSMFPKSDAKEITRWIGEEITKGLHAIDAAFEPIGIGRFGFQLRPRTLLGFCWLDLAENLARAQIEACADEGCSAVFSKVDPRQRFCSEQCANRVRFRKFYRRHRHAKR